MPRITPIKPDEVSEQKLVEIPPEVIEAVNALIVSNAHVSNDGTVRAVLRLESVCLAIRRRMSDAPSRSQMVEKGWLDFEPIFRDAGWDVRYDQPGFNETGPSLYYFEGKDRRRVTRIGD